MYDSDYEKETPNYEKLERLYKYINLDFPSQFRKNLQIINTPFNIREGEGFRLLPHDVGREIKLHHIEDKKKEELKKYKE